MTQEIEGDSFEYEFLEEAVSLLKNPIGVSVEIGVRRGYGSKVIIEAYRKYFPNVELYHLGIDPYGNILYTSRESEQGIYWYDNQMKREAVINFAKNYPEFHLINLEDTEFFLRFSDGYPVYNQTKKILNKFEIVHFDGPHDTKSVLKEIDFFTKRTSNQAVYIFDDIDTFNMDIIHNQLINKNFKEVKKGIRKAIYLYDN